MKKLLFRAEICFTQRGTRLLSFCCGSPRSWIGTPRKNLCTLRPTELVPQFAQARQATRAMLGFGLALMTLGMFQKIVLADAFLGPTAERIFDGMAQPGLLDAWLGTLAFSGQIFCDFAGYSTTAIGAAMCLGFAMPDNFRFPYAAIGFSDLAALAHHIIRLVEGLSLHSFRR